MTDMADGIILLVCGGRTFGTRLTTIDQSSPAWAPDMLRAATQKATLRNTLHIILQAEGIKLLIHGGAPGADTLANIWAIENYVPQQIFKANWSRFGKAAGALRNTQMLLEGKPTKVIAFEGGRGTCDMVRKAKMSRVPVMTIGWEFQ